MDFLRDYTVEMNTICRESMVSIRVTSLTGVVFCPRHMFHFVLKKIVSVLKKK